MSIGKVVPTALLAIAMTACSPSGNAPTASAPAPTAAPAATPAKPAPQSISAFKVQVTLSNAAKQQFSKSGETVIVAATFFGDPKPGTDAHAIDEMGQVDLGRKEIELHGEGTATFDGSAVNKEKLKLVGGPPQVNINVYSGRRKSTDNVLGCDMFQDSIQVAASKPIPLHCALLSEHYESRAITAPASGSM